MTTYNDTQTFPAEGVFLSTAAAALVVIDAGAGEVAVAADRGDGTFVDIPESPFTADSVFHLEIASGRWRFTPTGGAEYSFETRLA
ncbi:MAG: hypothetical protein KDK24_21730 [Pseudooceanicola sp.]|nr:hypothetical protein [Pseudooceanicola sp.]